METINLQKTFGGTAPFDTPTNWSSRGYVPHYDASGKYQMITYRLSDSLPRDVLEKLETATPGSAGGSPAEDALNRRTIIETYLDAGHGSCILADPEVSQVVIDNWKHFDGKRYDLIAYVVMPNHVHILIKVGTTHTLAQIVHSWKSYTAHKIIEVINAHRHENAGEPPALPGANPNPIWQREYWDRFIPDESHFNTAVNYIHENPEKAGLVQNEKVAH